MAGPSVDRRETFYLYSGGAEDADTLAMTAPSFDSASTPGTFLFLESCSGWEQSVTSAQHYGGRLTFGTARDLSTSTFLYIICAHRVFDYFNRYPDTWANKGISVFIFDSSDNYVEFAFAGEDYPLSSTGEGGWESFRGPSENGNGSIIIDRTRSPDSSSGTIDWTDVEGVEIHHRHKSGGGTTTIRLGIGVLGEFDGEELTGGEVGDRGSFDNFVTSARSNATPELRAMDEWITPGGYFSGLPQDVFAVRRPFNIGDGSTHTEFSDVGTIIVMYATPENAGAGSVTSPFLLLDDNFTREVKFDLAGSDYLVLDGTVFYGRQGSDRDYSMLFTGTSSESANKSENIQVFNAQYLNLYSDVPFTGLLCDGVDDIGISQDTDCTGATVRNSAGKGLYFTDGPADYSAITVTLENSFTGDEITIADDVAGTYTLSGVTATHTINVHNESATSAITVELPSSVTATSSTAGGVVTISTPSQTGQVSVPNITAGRIQICNITAESASSWLASTAYTLGDYILRSTGKGTELGDGVFFVCTTAGTSGGSEPTWDVAADGNTTVDNTVTWTVRPVEFDNAVTVSGYSNSWTTGEHFAAGDTIRLRWVDEDDLGIETTGLTTATGTTTFLDTPVDDTTYDNYGIDGTTVTEFAADYPNVEVDVNDTDDIWYAKRLYAWFKYNLTTEDGIRNFWGGITAVDDANLRINNAVLDLYLDNLRANTAAQGDTVRLYRVDNALPVTNPTTGGGGFSFYGTGQIYVTETGVSGVTAQDLINFRNEVFNHVVEDSESFVETVRLLRAESAGKVAVSGSTVTFRDRADSKDRITATVDNQGQRTSVSTDST